MKTTKSIFWMIWIVIYYTQIYLKTLNASWLMKMIDEATRIAPTKYPVISSTLTYIFDQRITICYFGKSLEFYLFTRMSIAICLEPVVRSPFSLNGG